MFFYSLLEKADWKMKMNTNFLHRLFQSFDAAVLCVLCDLPNEWKKEKRSPLAEVPETFQLFANLLA